ncbi:MAG: putative bifunctional diguanylate cyclase/phosphodiesterase [Candidatus Nanopelagicales bacterium]
MVGTEAVRAPGSPRVRRRTMVLLIAATAAAVLAVGLDAVSRARGADPLPWTAWLAALYAVTAGTALVVAFADRVRRDPLRRGPLRMLMIALAILGYGQVIGYTLHAVSGTAGAFDPRIEVIPSLLCFPFATYALARITWPRSMTPTERRLAALDCVVAVLALAVVWWSVVIPAWIEPEGTGGWQRIDQVLMFGALGTTACVGVVSRRIGSLPYPQLVRLFAGLSIYFLSDLAGQVVDGADNVTSVTYALLGYVFASWLLAGFALRPPLEPEPPRGRRRREQIANLIPVVLALFAGIVVVQAASDTLEGLVRWAAILAWTSILVGILTARLIAARELSAAQAEGAATVLAVRTREGWFRALVGDSADSVLVVDNAGRVLWTSPRFERDADFPGGTSGWPLADVLLDLDPSDLGLLLAEISTDPSRSGPYDVLVRSRSGEPLEMEAVIRPITDVEFRGFVVTARDVSDARRLARQLANSRRRDELTGLLSRDAFLAETARDLERQDDSTRVAVLTLDLERFAALNDGMGHETGDQILVAVAATFDRLPDVVLAASRIGSDTFALLLVTPDPEPDVMEVVDQCRESLRGLLLADGREIEVGFHAGYVVSDPVAGRTAEWHLEAADLALARSRSSRHARLVGYSDDMRQETERRLVAEERLRRALAEDRIEAWYQPVHRLSDGVVTGSEALARLRDVDGTVVQPIDFIPLAEELGLIGEIGKVVLCKAVRETARLSAELGHPMHVAVNIAVDQLTPDLVPTVVEVLGECQLPAARLSLEITESTLADRSPAMQQVLADLRALGIVVSLDDFGTGYSSLSYLSTLPVDGLKIDRSFVSVMGSSRQSLMLARSVVQLALALDLRTIAEGVETVEQADLLKGMGCDYAQGYLWARPLPQPEYEAYLRGPVVLLEAVEA